MECMNAEDAKKFKSRMAEYNDAIRAFEPNSDGLQMCLWTVLGVIQTTDAKDKFVSTEEITTIVANLTDAVKLRLKDLIKQRAWDEVLRYGEMSRIVMCLAEISSFAQTLCAHVTKERILSC